MSQLAADIFSYDNLKTTFHISLIFDRIDGSDQPMNYLIRFRFGFVG